MRKLIATIVIIVAIFIGLFGLAVCFAITKSAWDSTKDMFLSATIAIILFPMWSLIFAALLDKVVGFLRWY
jgi:hypothetical protein